MSDPPLINWKEAGLEHLNLAVEQYEKRFEEANLNYASLDSKARWLFGLTLSILSALTGYFFTNPLDLSQLGILAVLMPFTVIVTMLSSLFFAGRAFALRPYHGASVTPANHDIQGWREFLCGTETERKHFYAMRITHLAVAAEHNANANRTKSKNLHWGIRLAFCSIFLGVFFFLIVGLHSYFSQLACQETHISAPSFEN